MEPQSIRPLGTSDVSNPQEMTPQATQTPVASPIAGSQEAANMAVQAAHAPQFPLQPGAVAPVPQHLQTNPGPQIGASSVLLPPSGTNGTPALADDSDLIEKEWVVKAKQIVDHTKSDPYAETQELNKLKAEYIKKRYNKEIRLPES